MKLKEGRVGINGSLALVSQQVSPHPVLPLASYILPFAVLQSLQLHLFPGVDLQCNTEGEHLTWLPDERGLVPPGHRGLCPHL